MAAGKPKSRVAAHANDRAWTLPPDPPLPGEGDEKKLLMKEAKQILIIDNADEFWWWCGKYAESIRAIWILPA